MKSLAKNHSA